MHSAAFPQVPIQGDWQKLLIQLSSSAHIVSLKQDVRFVVNVFFFTQDLIPSPSNPFRHLQVGKSFSMTQTASSEHCTVVHA